jgi:hypothetical protein
MNLWSTCAHCGKQLQPLVEITSIGDIKQRWIYADCDCPRWRCPFCLTELDADQTCPSLGCFLVGNIAPLPVLA